MLYLSDAEVTSLIADDLEHVVKLMRQMFQIIAQGDYALGGKNCGSHGMRISYKKNSDERMFIAMPGYIGGVFDMAGMKWHGPNAPILDNDADSYYIVALNDANRGIPLAVLRADTLTRYRTAAVNALAAETLCFAPPKKMSVIGPGRITSLTVKYLLKKYPSIREIRIKGRGESSLARFNQEIQSLRLQTDMVVCPSVKDAVLDSDLVIINTGLFFANYGDMPILREAWIKPRSTWICSAFASFPDMMLLQRSIKVCDLFAMYECYEEELGYPAYRVYGTIGNRFADLIRERKMNTSDIWDLSTVLSGKEKFNRENDYPVIFSSGGIVLEDIALASFVYRKALEQKVGLEVN